MARITYEVIRKLESRPDVVPTVEHLKRPEVQAEIAKAVEDRAAPQLTLEGVVEQPNVAAIVARTVDVVTQGTIDIPRVLVVPRGEVSSGFHPFTLDLAGLRLQAVSRELVAQHLRTGKHDIIGLGDGGVEERRLEDYVVRGLIDFDDISYDDHADLLYDLATQTVEHFMTYLSEEDTKNVLRQHQREIARNIHAQMQQHYWEEAGGYEVRISKGFGELKPSAYTHALREAPVNYKVSPAGKSNMAKYLFDGFDKCMYTVQKFDSDAERRLAVILEREAIRWFRPARGQFQIYYRQGGDHLEYQPDFVAETEDAFWMLEPKASNQMNDPIVLAKRDAAVEWCKYASAHTTSHGGKPWRYALIPHDVVAENMSLAGLVRQYGVKG